MSAITVFAFFRLVVCPGLGSFQSTAREPTIYVVVSCLFPVRFSNRRSGQWKSCFVGRADLLVGQDARQRVPTIKLSSLRRLRRLRLFGLGLDDLRELRRGRVEQDHQLRRRRVDQAQ